MTPHILSEILNRPLLATPDKLHAILSVLNERNSGHLDLDMAALAPLLGMDKNGGAVQAESRPVKDAGDEEEKRVAVIPVIGSLIPRNRGFSDSSGLRSYRTMAYQMTSLLERHEVCGLVLDVDTYGGTAAGCSRFAEHILHCRETYNKPIYANIDLNCFSAGTWIASACDKIFLSDGTDAGMGSVGCLAIHRDISGRNEKEGDVYTIVSFGDRKADFNSLEPLSEDLHKKLEASVAVAGKRFAEAVAKNRDLEIDDVLAMQAGCFYGQAAIDAGLADGVATFSETIAMVAEEAEKRNKKTVGLLTSAKKGDATMSTKEQLTAILSNEDAPAALAELGFVPAEAAKEEQEKVLAEQKKIFGDAVNLAAVSGLNVLQVKDTLVAEDLSAETVSASLQTIKAADGSKNITSTITPTAGDGKHGLIAACEKLADK